MLIPPTSHNNGTHRPPPSSGNNETLDFLYRTVNPELWRPSVPSYVRRICEEAALERGLNAKGLLATWEAIKNTIVLRGEQGTLRGAIGMREIAQRAGVSLGCLAGTKGYIQVLVETGLLEIVGHQEVRGHSRKKRKLPPRNVYAINLAELERKSLNDIVSTYPEQANPPRPPFYYPDMPDGDNTGDSTGNDTPDSTVNTPPQRQIPHPAGTGDNTGNNTGDGTVNTPSQRGIPHPDSTVNDTANSTDPAHRGGTRGRFVPPDGTVNIPLQRGIPHPDSTVNDTGDATGETPDGTVNIPSQSHISDDDSTVLYHSLYHFCNVEGRREEKEGGEGGSSLSSNSLSSHHLNRLIGEITAQTIQEMLPQILHQIIPILQANNTDNSAEPNISSQERGSLSPVEALPPTPTDDDGDPLPALPAPPLVLYRDLSGSRAVGDKHRLNSIASAFDKASGGFGAYWLGQAILMADQCLTPTGKAITLPYIRGILKRWAEEDTWGSDVEEQGATGETPALAPTAQRAEVETLSACPSPACESESSPAPVDSDAMRAYRETTGYHEPLTPHQIALVGQVEHPDIWRDTCAWWVAVVDEQGREKKRYNPAEVEKLYDRYCQNVQRREASRPVSNLTILYLPMGTREEYLYRFDAAQTKNEKLAIVEEARALLDAQSGQGEEQPAAEPALTPSPNTVSANPTWEDVANLIGAVCWQESMGMDTALPRAKIAILEQVLVAQGEARPANLPELPLLPDQTSNTAAGNAAHDYLSGYEPPPGASWEMAKQLEQQARALEESGDNATAMTIWREIVLLEAYLDVQEKEQQAEPKPEYKGEPTE